MNATPYKSHYFEGSRSFIKYDKTPKILIEVLSFETQEAAQQCAANFEKDLLPETPFLAAETSWSDRFYLLIAKEFPDGVPVIKDQAAANKLARLMRRLADWYRYTVLLAQSN